MKLADFLVLFCFVFVSEVWGKLYHGTKFRFGIFSLIRVTSPKTGLLYFYLLLFSVLSFVLFYFYFTFIFEQCTDFVCEFLFFKQICTLGIKSATRRQESCCK